ncbi:MAG: PduL/EutD family phosphate acyltransferase [Pseudoramibacter sp.]
MYDEKQIRQIVAAVLEIVQKCQEQPDLVELGIPSAHIYCSQETVEQLFGSHAQLTRAEDRNSFYYKEGVAISGPKGSTHGYIFGPLLDDGQDPIVELSRSECEQLGIDAPVRESLDDYQSAACRIVGPAGAVACEKGAIIPRRSVSLPDYAAEQLQLKDKDTVSIDTQGVDGTIYENVIVNVTADGRHELMLTRDEAQAAGLKHGDCVKIIKK